MSHICSHDHVKMMDNVFRWWIHNPLKIYEPFVKTGMNVLDLGCGGGFTSIGMAKLVGETGNVTALDLQQEMLDIVKSRAERDRLLDRFSFHKSEPDTLNLPGKFDFINAFYMVHETPDTKAFLSEVARLMHDETRFFVAEPKFHVNIDAFNQMTEIAEGIGMTVESRPRIFYSFACVFRLK